MKFMSLYLVRSVSFFLAVVSNVLEFYTVTRHFSRDIAWAVFVTPRIIHCLRLWQFWYRFLSREAVWDMDVWMLSKATVSKILEAQMVFPGGTIKCSGLMCLVWAASYIFFFLLTAQWSLPRLLKRLLVSSCRYWDQTGKQHLSVYWKNITFLKERRWYFLAL
jgi:hypothetical protein